MKFLKILLVPFSLLYGLLMRVRNWMFDIGIFTVHEFKTPVISLGNLTYGGTGKTPHLEYIIRLLKDKKIATLSRGYGRKTNEFIIADENHTSVQIGDEPRQLKKKFPDVMVCVDNSRVHGITKIKELHPTTELILLDDAFQHRSVKPGLNILLTDYSNIYYNDFMLPTGTLREFASGILRADIIIITKSPSVLSPIDRRIIAQNIKLLEYQKLYFSFIRYGDFVPFPYDENKKMYFGKEYYFERKYTIVLLTGIANVSSLLEYLRSKAKEIVQLNFPDHHRYTLKDIELLQKTYDNIHRPNKIILTTEKDIARLEEPGFVDIIKKLPLFYMPIEMAFHEKDEAEFKTQIVNYVRSNK